MIKKFLSKKKKKKKKIKLIDEIKFLLDHKLFEKKLNV